MPRIPAISSRDEVATANQQFYDSITGSRGSVRGPFQVLLHSPDLASRVANVGAYVRFEAAMGKRRIELATIVAAREFDCAYVWAAHAPQAIENGVAKETVEKVANRSALDGVPQDDATIIQYVRELLQQKRVSASTFAAAQSLLGNDGLVEITTTAGYYGMLACNLNAFEVMPAADAPKLP